jgi:polysaccharide pyruvyl transferase WcaK-like protein
MKKRIGLVGFYGPGNFGDELMKLTLIEFLHEFDVELVHENILEPLFDDRFFEFIDRCDGIVIGGGDLLIPAAAVLSFWHQGYLKKPVYIYGVGVPQWLPATELALAHYKSFLQHENVRLIAARDRQSADWIREVLDIKKKIYCFPDIMCARSDVHDEYRKSLKSGRPKGLFHRISHTIKEILNTRNAYEQKIMEPKVLGLATRSFPDLNYKNIDALCEIADRRGYEIRQLILGTEKIQKDDLEALEGLRNPNRSIVVRNDILSLLKEISECSIIVSMKFHGCLAAVMMGKKTMALLRHDKFANLLAELGKAGYATDANDPFLVEKFDKLIREEWKIDVDYLYSKSKSGLNKLRSLIKKELKYL